MIAGIVFEPILPVFVVVLLGALLAGLTAYACLQTGSRLGRAQSATLTSFRLAGLLLIVLLLLQPSRVEIIPPPITARTTIVALDTSRSMRQTDAEKASRLDAARNALVDAGVVPRGGLVEDPNLRVFEFSEEALPVASSIFDLSAEGKTTRFHRSINGIFNSLGEGARALILLSDGHDFDMVNPGKTGFMARSRHTPIYAVAFGQQGKVRDVSVRITNYQPYCYVKQKARISGMLRLIGCEFEDIQVQLLRQNRIVETKRLNADEHQQMPVQFEVTEPEVGQFEYEIRVVPLVNEVDANNNSAITYLNVIDQQIQVLLLEGSPYWDTTFLQRSLMRNDKVDLDTMIQYAKGKARVIRKTPGSDELKIPETAEELNRYDLVILGRSVDQLLGRRQMDLLESYVKDHGGTVIFSRGRAFEGDLAKNNLEPVLWDDKVSERLRMQVAREGQALAPFRALTEQSGGLEALPDLIAGRDATEKKPLTATLATAENSDDNIALPGIVHRRYGAGQVLSVGVDGLWRWAFNAKVEGVNTLFDRFWDQMVLWLMAGRDFLPTKEFSFRTSSANILLGEKVYFRLIARNPEGAPAGIPLTVFQEEKEIGRTAFAASPGQERLRMTAEYLPENVGRYRAAATFPDGTQQESRFIVFDENLEETEVATDVTYLKRLCESSGGRLLAPGELAKFYAELRDEHLEAAPQTRLRSIWDQPWVFYLIGALFGVDWYLRRRWGLS